MALILYSPVAVDGVLGPKTIKAWQIFLQKKRGTYDAKRATDGAWGYWTIVGIQRWLQQRGYYKGYAIDGKGGQWTWFYLEELLRHDQGRAENQSGGATGSKPKPQSVVNVQRYLNLTQNRYA